MRKTLRRRFVLFAMAAVTGLLVVLIGAINVFSWVVLEKQSEDILHTLAEGDELFLQREPRDRSPFQPPMSMDTVKSARFFMVRTDASGAVRDVNVDQISSVTEQQAAAYARQITGERGRVDVYRYETRQLGTDRLIFFMDISGQLQTFVMVLRISCVIALACWLVVLLFVLLLSGRVVRPILAGMEKQKQFITNAGHELKTPLAIIQSNNDASALLCGETKYSRNIRQQTRRLNVLMTNLLTLARLDEEVRLPTESVNISQRIEELLADYEDMLPSRGLTLSADIQPAIMMQVHGESFSQMMSVLLDNAVKYTPEGGTIRLTVGREGGQIEIVEENPCGAMQGEDPERLFERFYRGDSARTQESHVSGYGIGLSAARAIAESFGGTLRATCPVEGMIRFTARF